MVENKKIALVTGGSSGIGSAIAIELAKKNVHVIITGKTLSGLEITKNRKNKITNTPKMVGIANKHLRII